MADFLVLSTRSSNSGLRSVQRKTAMPFLNLLRVMMYCARTSWEHLQETTEAPTTKSYQSPTNKKLKYIIQTKESKLLADKDNLLNPRATHTMLCLHMSNLLIGFPLPWNSSFWNLRWRRKPVAYVSVQQILFLQILGFQKAKTVQDWPLQGLKFTSI